MSSLALNLRYQARDNSRQLKGLLIVIALHAALGYALASGMARKGLNLIKKPLQAVIIQEVILPPPPPPPVQFVKTAEALSPKTDSAPPIPRPDTLPVPSVSPVPLPVAEVQTPPKSTLPLVAPAVAALEPHKAQVASMESEYASRVRAMLNAIKRYPTGRAASQQRPQGKVKVWFTLARSGNLLDAGVLESSNSNLLDDAALATVRRGIYPSFPANTWDGQDSRKFVAEMEFSPPSA